MKSFIVLILFLGFSPPMILSQTLQNYRLINPNLLNQTVHINVTSAAQDTSARISTIRSFNLRPGELKAVARIGTHPIKPVEIPPTIFRDSMLRAKVKVLPEIYFAKEANTNRQISYQILYVDASPLKMDFEKNIFRGEIVFLPVETDNPEESEVTEKQLASPDTIYVSYKEQPIPITIRRINFPPLDFPITYSNPMDSLRVKILTISKPTGYSTFLPVEPAIVLSSTRSAIQGFGLQEIPITVNLRGISTYRPISLRIMSSLGTIDSSELTLRDDSPGEVRLRSEGSGRIKVNVAGANYLSNSLLIEAVFPWLFLILSILGGLLGGIGKRYFGKGKIDYKLIISSCIIGLMVAAAYWGLGINLINFTFEDRGYNEAMVLALALLAGYFGIRNPIQAENKDS